MDVQLAVAVADRVGRDSVKEGTLVLGCRKSSGTATQGPALTVSIIMVPITCTYGLNFHLQTSIENFHQNLQVLGCMRIDLQLYYH